MRFPLSMTAGTAADASNPLRIVRTHAAGVVHSGITLCAGMGINSKLGDTFKLMTWAFR